MVVQFWRTKDLISANLVEIFSSVQGEGPDVGRSTLFVRFGGCDLRCEWCDSPHTWKPASVCQVETRRGLNQFATVPNPVSLDKISSAADGLGVDDHCFVSLTGGEPLLQARAAAEIAKTLRSVGPEIMLETHGVCHQGLSVVLPYVDVVSMDWKLPAQVHRAGERAGDDVASLQEDHERFLEIARKAPRLVVKIVITKDSRDSELRTALRTVASIAPDGSVVLQPVTPAGSVKERPSAGKILSLAREAESIVKNVRVIPQTHPVYGVR